MFKQDQERSGGSGSTLGDASKLSELPPSVILDKGLIAYPNTLNFYFDPPDIEAPIETLIDLAEKRQIILCTISEVKTRGVPQNEADREINKVIQSNLPLTRSNAITRVGEKKILEERISDALSHFVLRAVHSGASDSQSWFVSMEGELFLRRMKAEDSRTRNKFFWSVFKSVSTLDIEEKNKYIKELCKSSGLTEFEVYNTDFYVVPFQNASQLVSHRKVYINRGMAYVPSTEQSSLLLEAFKSHLNKSLTELSSFNSAFAGQKVKEIFREISQRCQQIFRSNVSISSQNIHASGKSTCAPSYNNINQLINYFPPCMRNIQHVLSNLGHLKYNDRLKYGLFLKWMGMSFSDSVMFWERSMHNIAPNSFKKEYLYNIRYNYGLEGKKKDFPPWSCRDILSRDSPPGNHGCPFLEFSKHDLVSLLELDYHCEASVAQKIAWTAKQGNYQLACASLLSVLVDPTKDTSALENDDLVQTPNQFYSRLSSKMGCT